MRVRTHRRLLLYVLLTALLPLAGVAEVILKTDFATCPPGMVLKEGASIADNTLRIAGSRGGVKSAILTLNVAGNCRITFDLFRGARTPNAKDGHVGMTLNCTDGTTFQFHNSGNGWRCLRRQPGRDNNLVTILKDARLPPKGGEAFAPIQLDIGPDGYELCSGKHATTRLPWTDSALANIQFYGYNLDAEIKNLQIETLAPAAPFVPTPPKTLLDCGFESEDVLGGLKSARLTPGVDGQAVAFSYPKEPRKTLDIPLPEPIGKRGTVMFWYRLEPERDAVKGDYPILQGIDESGKRVLLNVILDGAGFSTYLARQDGLTSVNNRRWMRGTIAPSDWHFYAMTFDETGLYQNMLDSLPYFAMNQKTNAATRHAKLDLEGIRQMRLYPGFAIDRLKVLNYPLSEAELNAEYRQVMPIDLLLDEAVTASDTPTVLSFRVAPGGVFMAPPPIGSRPTPAKVAILARVLDAEDKELLRQEYDVDVQQEMQLKLPPLTLAHGQQANLVFDLTFAGAKVRRSYSLTAWQTAAAQPATTDDYAKGALLFEKRFTTPEDPDILVSKGPVTPKDGYLELGPNKYHCLAIKVPFAKEQQVFGHPVLLEIDWPDDRPRNIGLYMYMPAKGKTSRDCLQSGITAGNLYPNSGQLQTARYLFYPGFDSYLFEVRTMSSDYPAAIAALRVYAIDGPLPKLKINYPTGMPHRQLGFSDEDQTVDYYFNHNERKGPSDYFFKMTDVMLEYLDYTGQEAWNNQIMRYDMLLYPILGSERAWLYPYRTDFTPYMYRAFGSRGKSVYATVHLSRGFPEFTRQPLLRDERLAKGWYRQNPFGQPLGKESANLLVPEIEQMLHAHVEKALRQLSPLDSFEGVDFWFWDFPHLGTVKGEVPTAYRDKYAKSGIYSYDDFTNALYRREAAPEMPDFTGPDRFMQRFEYLAQAANEPKWNAWNEAQVVRQITRLRDLLNRYKPSLKMAISSGNQKLFGSLADIPGVCVDPRRSPYSPRWNLQHMEKISNWDENHYDLVSPERWLGKVNSVEQVTSFHSYAETFTDSLLPEYGNYFQCIDFKPPARHALKDPVFCIAKYDMRRWVFGGQTIGSAGREAEIREFARAFCALPAKPFALVPGPRDPVVTRYLDTPNGRYLYCANTLFADCRVTLQGASALRDLSTGAVVTAAAIDLKPYELRSFQVEGIPGPAADLKVAALTVPETARQFYLDSFVQLETWLQTADEFGIEAESNRQQLAQARLAFADKRYAETHRCLFTAAWHQLKRNLADRENLVRTREMLNSGDIRINCGALSALTLPDGRLCLRDIPFADGLGYGYYGHEAKACVRDVTALPDAPEKELFNTEIYDIEGYKVKLRNGSYRVRLLMRYGYEPTFKKKADLSVHIAIGEDRRTVDLLNDVKGDFNGTVTVDFPAVKVTDGLLHIVFSPGPLDDCRLLNGILIEPVKP
ncbi:MAG: hypothetical protein PHT80_00555 [Lentisphaeria bacterium]|nr:hypothetical protein [Lentisphaeria bacterium]